MPPSAPAPAPARAAFLSRVKQGYRLLPAPIRWCVSKTVHKTRIWIQDWKPAPTPAHDGVLIAGLFSSACGLGEGARLQADALEAMGIAVERFDLSPFFDLGASLPPPPRDLPTGGGPMIVHMNPPLFSLAVQTLGRHRRHTRKVIAYWAWELESIPESWRAASRYAHAIWTPSAFCSDAVRRVVARLPIATVPHPVAAQKVRADRAAFGLTDQDFVILSFIDFNSNMARKNPMAVVDAYIKASSNPAMRHACLVLKVAGIEDHPAQMQDLQNKLETCHQRVKVIDQRLTRDARDNLIASCDVLCSLHRSEGFGLTLAEAIASGRHAIGTGWSGNTDFMTPENSSLVPYRLIPVEDRTGFYDPTLQWADPDIDRAADLLAAAAQGHRPPSPTDVDLVAQFEAAILAQENLHGLIARPDDYAKPAAARLPALHQE